MIRLWLRSFMVAVGIAILAVCIAGAVAGALLLGRLFADPPGVLPLAAAFLASVLILGYAGYRMGTARLVTSLDARELPPDRAPALHRRLARLCDRMDLIVIIATLYRGAVTTRVFQTANPPFT